MSQVHWQWGYNMSPWYVQLSRSHGGRYPCPWWHHHIHGLVQERRNSSALAMELCLFCINPSMGLCQKDVTPLLTHWSYVFLALTHRHGNTLNYWSFVRGIQLSFPSQKDQSIWSFYISFIINLNQLLKKQSGCLWFLIDFTEICTSICFAVGNINLAVISAITVSVSYL